MTGGKGLAVVIEATGHPPVVNTALQLADGMGVLSCVLAREERRSV